MVLKIWNQEITKRKTERVPSTIVTTRPNQMLGFLVRNLMKIDHVFKIFFFVALDSYLNNIKYGQPLA